MYRLKIIIADPDSRYVDKVTDYINSSHSNCVRLSSFTRLDLLKEFLQSTGEEIDILVAAPSFLRHFPELPDNVKLVAALSDGTPVEGYQPSTVINKYQPGDKLVNRLTCCYSDAHAGSPVLADVDKTRIVSVYSANGGSGKTSVAFGLAVNLTGQGYSVLFLSFESICSAAATIMHSGSDGFTHLMLSLRDNPEILPAKVEAYKCRDHSYGLDYLPPPENFLEISELNEPDINLLLTKLKQMSAYDFIIVDMDSRADMKALAVFDCSDVIVFLTLPDEISRVKGEMFLKQLQFIDASHENRVLPKLVPVVNKWRGSYSGGKKLNGSQDNLTIPAVPRLWSGEGGGCRFEMDGTFAAGIARLAGSII